MLFRIAFMVDEKKLGLVLGFLSGKVVNMEPPAPVRTVDDRPFLDLIDLRGRSQITTKEIAVMLKEAGRSAASNNYAAKQLVQAGVLRPKGGHAKGVYDVVRKAKKGGK